VILKLVSLSWAGGSSKSGHVKVKCSVQVNIEAPPWASFTVMSYGCNARNFEADSHVMELHHWQLSRVFADPCIAPGFQYNHVHHIWATAGRMRPSTSLDPALIHFSELIHEDEIQ
jgi:hypothetical protein